MEDLSFNTLADGKSCLVCLHVPPAQVVLLQAHYELYDGVGTVRTFDKANSYVSVMTTPCAADECLELLKSLKAEVGWQMLPLTKELLERALDFNSPS